MRPGGKLDDARRSGARAAPVTPSGLPATRPTTMAIPSVPVKTPAREESKSFTPAFARANSGTMTKEDQGSRACSTRASGETASRDSAAKRSHHPASASGG